MNRYLPHLIVVLSLALVFVYAAKTGHAPQIGFGITEKLNSYKITGIEVLAGNEFSLTLIDGKRVHGFVKEKTVPEAKEQVIKFINSTSNPRAVLVKSMGAGDWLVELFFTVDSPDGPLEVNLNNWLVENRLVFQQ